MASRRKQKIQSRTDLTEETSAIPNKIPRSKEIVFGENAVDFVGHCSFCLRLLNVYGTHIEGLAAPVLNSSLTDFRDIWQLLQKNYLSLTTGSSPNYAFVIGQQRNGNPIYLQVPSMCSLCHEEIVKLKTLQEKLVELMKALDNQVKSIKDIVLGCAEDGKSSWRGTQFKETLMNADVEDDRIDNTLRFLDALRGILKSCSTSTSSFQQRETNDPANVLSKNDIETGNRNQSSQDIKPKDDGLDIVSFSSNDGNEEIKSELDSDSDEGVKSEIDFEQGEEEMLEVSSAESGSDLEEEERYTNKNAAVGFRDRTRLRDDPLADVYRLERLTSKKKKRKHPSLKIWYQNCDICNKRLPCDQMSEHLRTHVQDFVYQCPNPSCNYAFITQYRLEKHHLRHQQYDACRIAANLPTGSRRHWVKKCETCDFTTNWVQSLRTHLQYHEASSQKNFTCPITGCGEKFTVKQSVEHHLETHVYKLPVKFQKCRNCKKLVTVDQMEEHLKTEHSVTETFPCKQCPFMYSSRSLLIDHLFKHRKMGMVCDICGHDQAKFSRMTSLRQHYFEVHKIGEKLLCEHCNQFFHTAKGLKQHIDNLHGPKANQIKEIWREKYKSRRVKCDICFDTVEFSAENELTKHKIKEHGAEPFECQICSQKFDCRLKFVSHKKSHDGIISRDTLNTTKTCQNCGKKFNRWNAFKNHWEKEHEKQTHVCDVCGKGFPTSANLARHKNSVHSFVPHICDACGDKFNTLQSLRRHQRVHTGERPFSCEKCGSRFRQKGNLKTHMKSHERLGDKFKPRPTFDRKRK